MEDTIEIIDDRLKTAKFVNCKVAWDKRVIERSINSKAKELESLAKTNSELVHSIGDRKVECVEQECSLEKLRNDNSCLSQLLIQKEIELSACGGSFETNANTCQDNSMAVIKSNDNIKAHNVTELHHRYEEVERQLKQKYSAVINKYRRTDYETGVEELTKRLNEKATIATATVDMCAKAEEEKIRLATMLQDVQSQITALHEQIEEFKQASATVNIT